MSVTALSRADDIARRARLGLDTPRVSFVVLRQKELAAPKPSRSRRQGVLSRTEERVLRKRAVALDWRALGIENRGKPAMVIIKAVADAHDFAVEDITGPRRFPSVKDARWDAMACLKVAHPKMSLTRIGRLFQRDHTTVLNALRKRGVPTKLEDAA